MFHKRVYTDRVALPPHDMHGAGAIRSVIAILGFPSAKLEGLLKVIIVDICLTLKGLIVIR